MNLNKLILTTAQIAGNNEGIGVLIGIAPGYDYENGKRMDAQTHTKNTVVFIDNNFEKVVVKIPGTKEIVTKEHLAQQGGKVKVKFKNLTGKFYRTNNGEYALSCSADSMEVLQ